MRWAIELKCFKVTFKIFVTDSSVRISCRGNLQVRWVNLTADEVDNVFGYVSGYHYHNFQGNETYYQSEIHGAHIIDKACRGPKQICGIEYHNGAWPPLSDDKVSSNDFKWLEAWRDSICFCQSKVTDFLDYYNKTTGKVYVLGVLEEHYTEEVAVYHKVKDMLPWIEKHLGEISVTIFNLQWIK